MKKNLYIALAFVLSGTNSFAQFRLEHLDLSVTGGSDGIGFELATPINDRFRIRTGASFFSKSSNDIKFDIEVGEFDPKLTLEQNKALSAEKFNKIATTLGGVTGEKLNQQVNIIRDISFNNFKLLFDFYPWQNKHWYITAGFYWGNNTIYKYYNTTADMTELMMVTMYNNMRKSALAEEPLITYNGHSVYLPYTFTSDIVDYGDMSIVIGQYKHDVYAQDDILWDYDSFDPITGEVLHQKGDVRYAKGDLIHKQGDFYHMQPDENNMVKSNSKINSFRPYVGMGYEAFLTKDKRTSLSINAGLLFIKIPRTTLHDGTNIDDDLWLNNRDFEKSLPCSPLYPIFNMSITRRLF
ncbi:MAG: hypothetical protein K5899_08665 [Bacteroidaceae bacterium]|nr:hypothetical protein [Bacteroidaceae bacterium]